MKEHYNNYLLKKAIIEHRIRKLLRTKNLNENSPSKLLSEIIGSNSIKIKLNREQRKKFIVLVSRALEARKTIEKYRKLYSGKPALLYTNVFGFSPKNKSKIKIKWNSHSIHFLFEKNELMSFWRKIGWGPGSGAYLSIGDTDVKIKELRGLVSFGRISNPAETRDIILHESAHLFDDYVKRKKFSYSKKLKLYYDIKSELGAYLHNLKDTDENEKKLVNKKSVKGIFEYGREYIDEFLGIESTKKRIKKLKKDLKKAKTKKIKKETKEKIQSLEKRLFMKTRKRKLLLGKLKSITKQVKSAVKTMPVDIVRSIVTDVPFERAGKKLCEMIDVYKTAKRNRFIM